MTPKWYTTYNKTTQDSRTFRSNNPIGVAFEMLGGDKYVFAEIDNGWIINNELVVTELNNINPNSLLK